MSTVLEADRASGFCRRVTRRRSITVRSRRRWFINTQLEGAILCPRRRDRRVLDAATIWRASTPPGAHPAVIFQDGCRRARPADLGAAAAARWRDSSCSDTTINETKSSNSPIFRGDSYKLSKEAAGAQRRRVHSLLRRSLHGRKRGHPFIAKSESDIAESRSGLFDGPTWRKSDDVEACWDSPAATRPEGLVIPINIYELLRPV